MLLGPLGFFESRDNMILIISYLSVGLRKEESWDVFLRKWEKCLWEYLIRFIVLAAIEVKKLFNMFAISIGSVLVVTLETIILEIFDGLLFILKIDFMPFQVFLMLSN